MVTGRLGLTRRAARFGLPAGEIATVCQDTHAQGTRGDAGKRPWTAVGLLLEACGATDPPAARREVSAG